MTQQGEMVATKNPQRIDSPAKFAVYCSATEILLSGWDVRINLMESVPPVAGQATILVHGSVVMSPIHAKALAQGLATAVSQYEEKFGELDLKKVLDFQNAKLAEANPAQ